jgi:hypothetical protein
VSATSAKDDAYGAFLSSSDLETWTASLDAYRGLLDGAEDVRRARPVDVLHALTLALYVGWLSARYGEEERSDRVFDQLHNLSDRAYGPPAQRGAEEALFPVVIAAAKGYPTTARRLVEKLAKAPPVEIALLVVPQQPTARAAMLEPFVVDQGVDRFVPAFFFYTSALLDLGYQSHAKSLLDRRLAGASGPLIKDLRGQLFELEGSWDEARKEYEGSALASHTYREAICSLILGASIESIASWPAEKVKRFTVGMLDFSGETDRAGVLRSASFVRACRWSGFDNWLVHFELGRLAFQRRHHAEAETHFAAARRAAPQPYRYAIHSSRFTNLTWLGKAVDVDIIPEALAVGHAALLEPAAEKQKAHIRTWLGRHDDESGVLGPVATTTDDYEIGTLHNLRGSIPEALQSWCISVGKSYRPRAFVQLLQAFASYGFESTASELATIVAGEAESNFFDSWELAEAIASVLEKQSPNRLRSGLLQQLLTEIEKRLEKLVESEFQNAIRAFDYFLMRRRLAPARRMLARAERLAEGSEELLLLAIARRKAAGGGWDPRALEALHEAQRQSTDRFERLLIAKELVHLSDLASARTILAEEHVLSDRRDLTPIEYVLALQCAKPCLEPKEREMLEAAAIEAIRRDADAGHFLRYGHRFASRLKSNIEQRLEITFPTGGAAPDVETSKWKQLVDQLERLHNEPSGEQELRLLNTKVDELRDTYSPFARLALWGLHLDRFDAQLRMIDRLRPRVADDQTPMARDVSPRRSRAQQLARRWRTYLVESEPAQASRQLGDIRAFLDQDKDLTVRWDGLRNAEAEKPSKNALLYAKHGAALLGDIASDAERLAMWPSFLGIRAAVDQDARALVDRLHERAASVRDGVTA